MAALRVLVDTHVLVSGIAYPGSIPGKILSAWRAGSIEVLLSRYILAELKRVLPKLRHRHGLSDTEMADLVEILSISCALIEPGYQTAADAVREANDVPILAALVAGIDSAALDYLITFDKDLLALSSAHPILTTALFWAKHGA